MITAPSRQIVFPGRSLLGVFECGDPRGKPVFYFHGFPGSRLEVKPADTAARRRGIRMIGIDRPGYGLSSPRPGRRLMDWPDDVLRLADFFGLQRFTILGVSGGGPYAAACAYKIPGRLHAVGIAAGLGPVHRRADLQSMSRFNRIGLQIAGCCPRMLRPPLALICWLLRRRPEKALQFVARQAGSPDGEFLQNPELFSAMKNSFRESMRSGIQGAEDDLRIYSRPWEFSPAAIRSRVYLWHGERDRLVPAAMARQMAASISDCRARFIRNEGHFSLFVHWMDAILSELTAA